MRRRWAARPVSSVIAAAASIPTPASLTAAISAPARTEQVRHGLPVQSRPVRGANARGRRARLRQCAAHERERHADDSSRSCRSSIIVTAALLPPMNLSSRGRSMSWSIWRPARSTLVRAAGLAARFLIPEGAKIVVSGVDKDGPIERWWELKDRRPILAALKDLGIALITTPNYSVLTDVPRTDNLHAMKRILMAWTEMASAGLATALHVNAADRTRLCPLGRIDRRTGRRSKFWRSNSRQAAAVASASTGMSRSSARWPIASGVRWRLSFVAADESSTRCSSISRK